MRDVFGELHTYIVKFVAFPFRHTREIVCLFVHYIVKVVALICAEE